MKSRSSRTTSVLLALGSVLLMAPAPGRGQDRRPDVPGAERSDALVEKEHEQVMQRVTKLRAQIAQITGRVDVSPQGIGAAIEQLQRQQEQLMLDEAGAQGRREGLERAIKEYTQAAADRAASDEAVRQLEAVLDVRQAEFKRKLQLQKVGALSQEELNAAEAAVAQARADVAEAKHRVAGDVGPNSALDVWNRELMNLSIEQMERRARLDYIHSRLDKYSQVTAAVSELERMTRELRSIEARSEALRQRLDLLRNSGGNDETGAPPPPPPNTRPSRTQEK